MKETEQTPLEESTQPAQAQRIGYLISVDEHENLISTLCLCSAMTCKLLDHLAEHLREDEMPIESCGFIFQRIAQHLRTLGEAHKEEYLDDVVQRVLERISARSASKGDA